MSEPRDSPAEVAEASVVNIPISELRPFTNHPFQVLDDERMMETVESVKNYGVLVPIIVRPFENRFEIISGHRRRRACELAGIKEVPAIVRDLDDDEAIIIMVDSNLQREHILPSEKAKAYQMKLEAIKRRAGRPSQDNCDQVGHDYPTRRSVEILAEHSPDSRNQIQRFIRLNNLEAPLIDKVDNGELAFTPAVELSYLKPEEQQAVINECEKISAFPSLSQAKRMKKLSKTGSSSPESIAAIMHEQEMDEDFAGIESTTVSIVPTTGRINGRVAHVGKAFERADGFSFILEELQVAADFYMQEVRAASSHYTPVMQSPANTDTIRNTLAETLKKAFEAFNIKEETI